jgi:inner membrane transporter RhtA
MTSPKLVPGVALPILAALAAMAAIQAGAAFAKPLFPIVGPEGAATLRLVLAAAVLSAFQRPWRERPAKPPWLSLLGLGASMGGMILLFFMALERLPQGVAVAIQFLGPLGVALAGARRRLDLAWAVLALAGVWALLGGRLPGEAVDAVGVALALGAAACWAVYILCGRTAGAAFGRATPALATALAALVVLPSGVVTAGAALFSPAAIPLAFLVAVVSAAIPFSLELYALPRMPARTFGILMSLEPAIAALSGLLLLGERLRPVQVAGVAAVIVAAAGAAWSAAAPEHRPA